MKKWTTNDIPNQKGKIIIVTGANAGLGYEDSLALAKKGATVIVACRNKKRGKTAFDKIKKQIPNAKIHLMTLDLADLKSVKTFAKDFKKRFKSLHVLINNAGVMIPPYSKTKDGFELQFGTNHLGHFALTGLLLEVLQKTKASRIVNVSSMAHKFSSLNFDDLNWEKREYNKTKAYGTSKIANLYFTYELKRRQKKISVVAAHPGWSATRLQRYNKFFDFFNRIVAQSAAMGALPTLYAATAKVNCGDYYGPGGFLEMRGYPKKVPSNKLSHDKAIAKKLWDVSEKLTGVNYKF